MPRTLALVLGLVALVAGATGLYPILIARAYDAFAASDAGALVYAPAFVVAVTAVKGFALYAPDRPDEPGRDPDRGRHAGGALRAPHRRRLLAQLGRESPAALTQRFTTDFAFIKEALTRLSTVALRDIATLLALVAAMLWIDPVLTLVAAVAAPLLVRPIARIGRKLRRVSASTQEGIGAMAGLVSESLGGARIAKTYRLEGYLKGRARQAFDEVRALKMKAANARARLDPLLEIGGGLAVAGVLLLIGRRIVDGGSTVGEFTGFVTALLLAAQPIRALGNLNAILQEAMAALQRTFAVMDEEPRIADRPGATALRVEGGEIRFAEVRFRYRADVPALDGVDVVAPAGRTTALVGRSGSGKSTLLALVPRLYDVTGARS